MLGLDFQTTLEKKRILVVEDEILVAFDIERSLEKQGYSVTSVVDSAEEAIEQARLYLPDLVLMDIRLKGEMSGITAAEYIQENFRIPIVFLTAHSDEATLQQAMGIEPYGYILKPFEERELKPTLELAFVRFQNELKLEKNRSKSEAMNSPERTSSFVKNEVFAHRKSSNTTISPLGFLKTLSPFDKLLDYELRSLAELCHIAHIKSGELITSEGEEDGTSFIVISGRVAMLKTSMNGKELIVELLPPGDFFSLVMALQQDASQLTARAQTDCEVLKVPTSSFFHILDEHPEIYRGFVEYMTARLRASHDFARGLAHDRVEVRIASAICALVPRFAAGKEDSYRIVMTRQEIADFTGTTPETAIRTTKAMERLGLLSLDKPGIIKILDLDGLQDLAESE